MKFANNLTISSYTLGTTVSLYDRIHIAAESGFTGIGLRVENYMEALAAGFTDAHILTLLKKYHLKVTEIELLTDWGANSDRTPDQQKKEQLLFHMARLFKVKHINATLFQSFSEKQMISALKNLCIRAEELDIAIEFMPYSSFPTLQTVWRVIQQSECQNAKIICDAWHWTRAHQSPENLENIPADRIVAIQVDDAHRLPYKNLRQESRHDRLPAGSGSNETIVMLHALKTLGVQPRVISTEMLSDRIMSKGLLYTAKTSYTAAQKIIKQHWDT